LRRALATQDKTVRKVALLGTLLTLIDPYFFKVVRRTHGASALGVFLSFIDVGSASLPKKNKNQL
jgi:hypothetical protein